MKNTLYFGTVLIVILSTVLQAFLRYYNQNLHIDNYNLLKTGNLISVIFYALIVVLIIANIFSAHKTKQSVILFLLFLSIAGLIFLIISYISVNKEIKTVVSVLSLVSNSVLLVSVISLIFSRSNKLYLFSIIIRTIFFWLICILIIFLRIYTFNDDSALYETGKRKADAGIIMGAAVWGGNRPSPVLRERINKGFEIYKKQYVSYLVLTGGGSPNEKTEAEVARKTLIEYGVEYKNLYTEQTSNSTLEQVFYLRDTLYNKLKWNRIILISDNYHLFRVNEICEFNNIKSDCISSDTPLSTEGGISYCIKETSAILIYWMFGLG